MSYILYTLFYVINCVQLKYGFWVEHGYWLGTRLCACTVICHLWLLQKHVHIEACTHWSMYTLKHVHIEACTHWSMYTYIHILSIYYPYIIHIYYPYIIHILSIYYPHILSIYYPHIIHILSIYYPYKSSYILSTCLGQLLCALRCLIGPESKELWDDATCWASKGLYVALWGTSSHPGGSNGTMLSSL